MSEPKYRVGRKVPYTLYDEGRFIGSAVTALDAKQLVRAANRGAAEVPDVVRHKVISAINNYTDMEDPSVLANELIEAGLIRNTPPTARGATHCDNCGLTWLDDGLNPLHCPYCTVSSGGDAAEEWKSDE